MTGASATSRTPEMMFSGLMFLMPSPVTWKSVAECEALYREFAQPAAAGQRLTVAEAESTYPARADVTTLALQVAALAQKLDDLRLCLL